MSPDTRLMFGLSLILVPTIVYGGLTVLGVVTNRLMGSPEAVRLSEADGKESEHRSVQIHHLFGENWRTDATD